MTTKVTPKIVEEVVTEIAGEDVLPLVRVLKKQKNLSEFKLASALKKEINITRNMLYRLYNANLVSFIRKKDKKKGWYIYYWTFNQSRVQELVQGIKQHEMEKLKDRLAREQGGHFFICPAKCIRLDFDQATDFEFKCPECGELLQQEDNTAKIADIQKQLQKLEQALAKKPVKTVVPEAAPKKAVAKKAKAKKSSPKKKR